MMVSELIEIDGLEVGKTDGVDAVTEVRFDTVSTR